MMRRFVSCHGSPSYGPEPTVVPSPAQASVIVAASSAVPSSGWTTTRTSIPYCRAKSRSRWSWAGTAMIAPVPYSIRT